MYEQLALIPLCLQDQQEGCFEALDTHRRTQATLHRRQGRSTSLKAVLKARLQLLWQSTRQPRHVQGGRGMEGTLENDSVPERIVSKIVRPQRPSMNANTCAW